MVAGEPARRGDFLDAGGRAPRGGGLTPSAARPAGIAWDSLRFPGEKSFRKCTGVMCTSRARVSTERPGSRKLRFPFFESQLLPASSPDDGAAFSKCPSENCAASNSCTNAAPRCCPLSGSVAHQAAKLRQRAEGARARGKAAERLKGSGEEAGGSSGRGSGNAARTAGDCEIPPRVPSHARSLRRA